MSPPKDAATKAKGLQLAKICQAIDQGLYKGRVRPAYPRLGPLRAEVAVPLPSGELRHIAKVYFQERDGDRAITSVSLADELVKVSEVMNRLSLGTLGMTPPHSRGSGGAVPSYGWWPHRRRRERWPDGCRTATRASQDFASTVGGLSDAHVRQQHGTPEHYSSLLRRSDATMRGSACFWMAPLRTQTLWQYRRPAAHRRT